MPQDTDSMYGGDGPTLAPDNQPDADKTAKEDGEEGQTYLVNKEVCPGMKIGDELKGRIVAVHEQEYECEYEPMEDKEEKGSDEGMAPKAPEGAMDGGEAESMYG